MPRSLVVSRSRFWGRFGLAMLLGGLALGARVGADPRDAALLAQYDQTYAQAAAAWKGYQAMGPTAGAAMVPWYKGLRQILEQCSPAGKAGADWQARDQGLRPLEVWAAGVAAAAGGAPAGVAPAATSPAASAAAPTAGAAAGLSGRDRQLLAQFDANAGQLPSDPAQLAGIARGSLAQMVMMLDSTLKGVSAGGQQTADWTQRKQRLAALQGAAMGALTAAPPPPPPPKHTPLTAAARDYLKVYDQEVARFPKQEERIRQLGRARASAMLEAGSVALARLTGTDLEHPEVLKRQAQLAEYRASMAAALAPRSFDTPRPEARPGDPQLPESARAAHETFLRTLEAARGALESPAGKDEVDLRCSLAELDQQAMALASAAMIRDGRHGGDESRMLAVRLADWEVARLRHGLDAAFDPPEVLDGYATQNERDRLSGTEQWLRERIWSENRDPLVWQKPERVAAMRQKLDEARDTIAAAAKHPRSSYRFDAECALRQAEARFARELAEAKATAESVGDIGAQLATWQATFPEDSFDPRYTGGEDPEAVRSWARRMRNWEDGVPGALAFFEEAAKKSVEARKPEFRHYVGWFKLRVRERIREAIQKATSAWSGSLPSALNSAKQDIGEGTPDDFRLKVFQNIRRGIAWSYLLEAFQDGYQGKVDPEIAATRGSLQASYDGMVASMEAMLRDYRMPAPASRDPALLDAARGWIHGMVGKERCRGLRISQGIFENEEREVSGNYVILTWWRSFRVDVAIQKRDTDRWYHESFRVTRRVDSAGTPIGDWQLIGAAPNYSHPILEANIDEP